MAKKVTDTGTIERLLRAEDVVKASGARSIQQLYNLMSENRFPRPVKIGERAVAWIEHEVLEWQRQRIDERDAKLAKKSQEKADAR
jgi:prophage regulatory protein